jgi:hypothetical protein
MQCGQRSAYIVAILPSHNTVKHLIQTTRGTPRKYRILPVDMASLEAVMPQEIDELGQG